MKVATQISHSKTETVNRPTWKTPVFRIAAIPVVTLTNQVTNSFDDVVNQLFS